MWGFHGNKWLTEREREKEREEGVYMYVGTEGKESQNSKDASEKESG